VQEYAAPASAHVFDAARECFEAALAWLSGSPAGGLDHGRLESDLDARGREVLRLLFQGHLDLRAVREARRLDVAGAGEAAARTRVEENHRRGLATVFGGVTVTRMAYRAPGAVNLHPADAVLNLPEEKHSHGLRRLAAIESARGSFEAAGEAIRRVTGTGLGKRQAEQLARAAAADVDSFYGARRPGSSPQTDVLVLSFDGKGIVMVPGALREATAKAAAAGRRKLATRLSPGEKRGRKRMAEIAAVYDAAPVPRTAADIITPPGHAGDQPRSRGPAARRKWLTASVTDGIPEVIAAGFGEAHRRDPGHKRTWIALADGNAQQIEHIQAQAALRGVDVAIVCDFVHVLEYLWQAAWCFFYEGDPGAEAWVAAQAGKILHSKAGTVAAAIRRKATANGYSPAERKNADRCASYLTSKKPFLDYATALERGWPVATGIIEGACRHIVKDRMDITGARWGLDSAEAILKLRTLISNGNFDDYWSYHLRQEQHRVHHARYRNGLGLAA
jgi:hypothetical protein